MSRRAMKVGGNHPVTGTLGAALHPVNVRSRREILVRERHGIALDRLACGDSGDAAPRRRDPGASARARRQPQARCAPPARAQPLLSRCRLGRPRGRRAHDAIRDPRCRALPAGARARDAHRERVGEDAAGHDRGACRAHRAGRRRGAGRARPRLSRRTAVARRHEGRERGRADRACRSDRARNPAGRILSPARRRRHRAAGLVLAAVRRDRERRRDQDRAVQPLSHARRGARRGRGGRRGPHHALHRQ